MTDLLTAVTAFLSRLGLPVYLADQVPDGAGFPYVAYRLTDAPFGQPATLEVTGWHRGEHANALAAGFLDRVAELVPDSGAILTLPRGRVTLHPGAGFRSVVADRDALGGRAVIEVRCYLVP